MATLPSIITWSLPVSPLIIPQPDAKCARLSVANLHNQLPERQTVPLRRRPTARARSWNEPLFIPWEERGFTDIVEIEDLGCKPFRSNGKPAMRWHPVLKDFKIGPEVFGV